MRSVFISYDHRDAEPVNDLHQALANAHISVWRDSDKLQPGSQWPEEIGKAISEQDVFIVCWSINAKTSEHVNREWNLALALKKRVIPFLLDATLLPNALLAFHAVKSVGEIVHALAQNGLLASEPNRIQKKGIAKQKSIWTVLFLVVFLAIAGALEINPQVPPSSQPSLLTNQTFSGIIRDDETRELIENVKVYAIGINSFEGDTLTNHLGQFIFTFQTAKPIIDIEAHKSGYTTLRYQVPLTPPYTHMTFPLTPHVP